VTTKWFDQILAAVFAVIWVVKKTIQNRRSPLLKYVMSGTALIVSLIPVLISLFQQIQIFGFVVDYYSFIWKLGYAVIISGNIFYQLKK
jgi:hypothetical protein